MLDLFVGTISTAKACLMLDKNRGIDGCNKDASRLQKSIPSLVEIRASHLSNEESDCTGNDRLKASACIYQAARKRGD